MARPCTLCTHPDREALDAALVAGEPFRGISRRAAVSPDAVERHAARHLPTVLTKAKEAKETSRAETLLDVVRGLAEDAHRIKRKAEKAEDLRTALDAVGKLTKIVELLAKVRNEIKDEPEALRFVVTMADGRMASTPAAEIPVTAYVVSPPIPPPAPAAVAPEVLAPRAERPLPRRTREEDPVPPPAPTVRAPRLVTPTLKPWFNDLQGL